MMSSVLREYAQGPDFRSIARAIQVPFDRCVILGTGRESQLMWINVRAQPRHYGTDCSFHCDGAGDQSDALATCSAKGGR